MKIAKRSFRKVKKIRIKVKGLSEVKQFKLTNDNPVGGSRASWGLQLQHKGVKLIIELEDFFPFNPDQGEFQRMLQGKNLKGNTTKP